MRYVVAVEGIVDTKQFWPSGTSDADTVKLDVSGGGFFYGAYNSDELNQTHIFDDAYYMDGATKKKLVSKKGIVTIRLQGVDAPELHLPVQFDGFEDIHMRQYLGKTSTVELGNLVGAERFADCQVWAYVDRPGDLFDVYGRLIGSLFVDTGDTDININEWLLASGWAFPAFYASMEPEEVEFYLDLALDAREGGLGVWRHLSNRVLKRYLNLKFFYGDRSYDPLKDVGPVLFPKIFRRAAKWKRGIDLGVFDRLMPFRDFLAEEPAVRFSFVNDFLESGIHSNIEIYYLEDVVGRSGRVDVAPQDVVFYEKESRIFDRHGVEITEFEENMVGSLITIRSPKVHN